MDFVNELIDGDAAIQNDLNDAEPLSTESILEAWRNSVSRQHNAFIRRKESKLWMSSRKVSKLFFLKEACGLSD